MILTIDSCVAGFHQTKALSLHMQYKCTIATSTSAAVMCDHVGNTYWGETHSLEGQVGVELLVLAGACQLPLYLA